MINPKLIANYFHTEGHPLLTHKSFLVVLLVLGSWLLVLSSCQKEITIELPPYESEVYIECILNPGKEPKLYMSETQAFFGSNILPQDIFARGANATITSDIGSDILVADSTFDKFRCRWIPFYLGTVLIEYGKTYTLEVIYAGKTYSAQTTINQPKVEIDSVLYIADFYDLFGGHDGVQIFYTDAAGPGNYYRFQMDRMIDNSINHAHVFDLLPNNCTETDELFPVLDLGRTIYNDNNADAAQLTMLTEVTFEYNAGDTAYIIIQSLDKTSADFFDNLDRQLQSIQNPFVEPVFLHSKIEGCLGVFGSAVLSDSVLFIYPQDNP